MTMREALGGRWATHWVVWAALFVPTSLLVGLRESVTGFDEWWWPLLSAVLQHLAVGIIVLGGGALARQRTEVLPLSVVAALWVGAALARGTIAGALAAAIAGGEPEYVERSLVWVLGTIVWVPLVVYTAAQIDRRRHLIDTLDAMAVSIEQQRERATSTGAEVRRSLTTAVRDSLQPALGELVASLESSRNRLSATSLAELSLRISQLHDRTADLLEPTTVTPERPSQVRSSVRRAHDVPPRLPWLIAGLAAISTAALMVPDSWRVFGELAALEVAISVAAASVVIGFVPWLITRLAPQSHGARHLRATFIAGSVGIGLAILVMLNDQIDPITQHGIALVPLLVIALAVSVILLVTAVVLADANSEAHEELSRQSWQRERERAEYDDVVNREQRRVAELLHGPVQGRLAACVMALNFSASSGAAGNASRALVDPSLVDAGLVDAVLDHLKAASRDLTSIATVGEPSSP